MVLDLLAQRGRLGVAEAAAHLSVSEATVRRDFAELARRHVVTRQHGEIVASSITYELPYRYRSSQSEDSLERIAAHVAGMVRPDQDIAINGGTTTTAVARAITAREDLADNGHGITLVTNALNIATEAVLRPYVRCVSLGGLARPESYEVAGPLTEMVLAELWFDLAIVGVNGLSAEAGATCRFSDEAAIVREMVRRADRTIVVAGGDKLGKRALAGICASTEIAVVVTTAAEDHEEVHALRQLGVQVACV